VDNLLDLLKTIQTAFSSSNPSLSMNTQSFLIETEKSQGRIGLNIYEQYISAAISLFKKFRYSNDNDTDGSPA